MPVMSDREYRTMTMEVVDVRAAGEDSAGMWVEGYASTFNHRYSMGQKNGYRLYEQVAPTAFEGTDMTDVIMQYDHEGRVFARTRNDTLQVTTDEIGLKIRARLDGTEIGRQFYEEIRGGYTDRMSFGFSVPKDGEEVTKEKDESGETVLVRTITHVRKLYDVSAVSLPANDATEISVRSLVDGLIAQAEEERLADEERQRKMQAILAILEGV